MAKSLSDGGAGVPGNRLIRVVSVIRITADYGVQTTSKRYHLPLRVECTLFYNLPGVCGSLRVLRLPPPLKLVAMVLLKYC
jgi:hypothetical protein